jgi:hypothetical protein
MVNKRNWLGMLVLVLVFGMTVLGCDDTPEDDYTYDDRPYLSGMPGFDNYYPVVGETITAGWMLGWFGDHNEIGTPSWTWYKTEEDASFLSSVTNKTSIGYGTTYTVKQNDVGFWIWVEVSYSGNQGTKSTSTNSTVIGIPATANVSISMRALYFPSRSSENHFVEIKLTLSDGRWDDVSYSTASQWITMSGIPSVSSWYTGYLTPSVSARGRELVFSYWTRSDTTLSISNLTATLSSAQLGTMRNSTNVYNTLTAGTSTASVSQWTFSDY